MKRILLLGAALLLGSVSYSQIFSDNFDSYTPGDYLGLSNPNWSTWSGVTGGNEDVLISDDDAASAPNSIYFKSTSANGGPQDVILKFEDVYTSGVFSLQFNIKVVEGKGAYFNLQQNHVVGQVWALQAYLLQTGVIKFDAGSTSGEILLEGNYPNGEWFNLKLEIDLTTNIWEVFIDDSSIGTFSNPINSIGIWDIFPVNPAQSGGNGQSEFYIDDVSYNHVPAVLPPLNAGVILVNSINGLVGQTVDVTTKIRNLGEESVTSFDVSYSYNDETITESVDDLDLESFETYTYTFQTPLTLVEGSNPLTVTVSDVNGLGEDGDPSDDSKTITINPLSPPAGRIVVGEEATGTWCTWCPRGAVFMDYMAEKYDGYWAGIAVHNGDPMVNTIYDTGIGTKIQGYPSLLVDRGTSIDPSQVEDDFVERILTQPKAIISNGASFNSDTRELTVSLTYDFISNISGNWKVACVLTEDGVTGTSSGYAQVNAYAGGNNGEMGGYENLPNPVPASEMVYNHVAREIAPSFAGDGNLIPNMSAGEQHTVCVTFTIPNEWNVDNMNIIGMLINAQGRIDNGSYSTVNAAISSGLADNCDITMSVEKNKMNDSGFSIYPNPATEMAFVSLKDVNGNVTLSIVDITGKMIANKTYKEISGAVELPINTSNLAKGTYIVTIENNGSIEQKKLIVQ